MNKQFSFDAAGVNEWLEEVYMGGQSVIDSECTLMGTDFVSWMTSRFGLDTTQVQFLTDLGALTQLSYSASIQDTLQHHGIIALEKEGAPATKKARNPKVVYKEQRNAAKLRLDESSGGDGDDQEVSLTFRIVYPDPEN